MKKKFDIYYDSLTEARWFSSLNSAFDLKKNNYIPIGRRGSNPKLIDEITKYDKPDIILISQNKPLLVIEITQEVPTGHNVGQRFARLVRAIEMGIPCIYFFPFDAKKHGEYSSLCNLNIRLIQAAIIMLQIHHTPLLCMNWKTDGFGEIITDGSENNELRTLIKSYVESNFNKQCEGIQKQLLIMKNEYNTRLRNRPSYAQMPPSVSSYYTKDFTKIFDIKKIPNSFLLRDKTFVYKIEMKPEKCKRQDPYTGTTFIYDYILCRTGAKVEEKKNNIVLYFPHLSKELWIDRNPNDESTKSCNWYLTANMLLFNNGFIFLR